MSLIATIPVALGVIDKILGLIPNYDQRQKERFHKLRTQYENEKNSSHRDDNLVDAYRTELLQFIESFAADL